MLLSIEKWIVNQKVKILMKSAMTFKQSRNAVQGFTLIELVVVIVILGILAATVAPKYIDLTADANTATLEAVMGSMKGASALVNSKSIIIGNQNESSSSILLNNGDTLDIGYGYPISPGPFDAVSADEYWRKIIDISDDFVISASTSTKMIIYPRSMGVITNANDACLVSYDPPKSEGEKPTFNINECI